MAKTVFAHYMPSLPIALDDVDPLGNPGDYYKRNYLNPNGESNAHVTYGGFLRDAPQIRADITRPLGGDYVLSDMREEVRRAKAYGIDGFSIDLLNISGSANHTRTQKLMEAAVLEGGFKCLLIPDMTSSSVYNLTQQAFVDAIAQLASYASAYRLADNRLVLAPFIGTYNTAAAGTTPASKTPTWWSQVMTLLANQGIQVAFILMTNNLTTQVMDAFDGINTYGYAPWGTRDPVTTNNSLPNAAAMRARSGNANKIWMAPVSIQDSRPQQKNFYESNGSQQLRDSWSVALQSCTGPDDIVQLITWNDYVEGSFFGPSRRGTHTPGKISQYYITRFKTGSYPTPTVDAVHLFHRPHLAAPIAILTSQRDPGTTASPNSYTTLAVQALGQAFSVGDKLHFTSGQWVTVAAAAAAGATTITVQAFTPTATYASGAVVTKRIWTFVPPNDNYGPMINRRYVNSVTSPTTVNIVEVLTYLTSPADVVATIGGVAQASYTAPAGEYSKTFTASNGAAPTVVLTRNSSQILSVTSLSPITATPVVQDLTYVTSYAENPPTAVNTNVSLPAPRWIMQATDTAANWTATNPLLYLGEVLWEQPSAGASPTKAKIGPGRWNDLPYVLDTTSGSSFLSPDIQTFSANGTWTKPTGLYRWARITVQGAGGGGGSGRRGAAATVRCGGGGGAGGGRTERIVPFSELAATEAVVVPSPGTGGPAATVDSTDGTTGTTVSAATTFGSWCRAGQAAGGNGGTAAAGAGGGGGTGQFTGGSGGAASTTGGAGVNPNSAPDSGAGGGSGGGITTANAASNGGSGGGISSVLASTPAGGIVGGSSPTTIDQATGSALPAPGGGGGAASTTAAAQAGAVGGRYGGGGGGGGASTNGFNSGAGGNGGPGYVRVVCF